MVDNAKAPKPTAYKAALVELRKARAHSRATEPLRDSGTLFGPTEEEEITAARALQWEVDSLDAVEVERAKWEAQRDAWNAQHEESLWVK